MLDWPCRHKAYLTRRPTSVYACVVVIDCRGRLTTRGTKGGPASKLKGHSKKKACNYMGGLCQQSEPKSKYKTSQRYGER